MDKDPVTRTVAYGTERAAAEAAVAGLAGARNVFDDIEISYAIDPVDVDLHVQQALDRSAAVPDGSDVNAGTKDGVITLTGHVRTWAEHDAVIGAALMARASSTSATNSRSPADLHPGRCGGPPPDRFADLGGHHDQQGHGWVPDQLAVPDHPSEASTIGSRNSSRPMSASPATRLIRPAVE